MAVTDACTTTSTADSTPRDAFGGAGMAMGLDVLQTTAVRQRALPRLLLGRIVPPVTAVLLVLAAWQLLCMAHVQRADLLPGPLDVWDSLHEQWLEGTTLGVVWTSVSRGVLGFLASVIIASPLGLVIGRVNSVRAAIGPILTGLQAIPSVAWVPAAILWFGLSNAAVYAVVLLGAVPSIAGGLVAGIDRVQPVHLHAGRTMGATGIHGIRHILLPAALPGYVAGLRQGWAFAWRSLMAAELIAGSPSLGLGLGRALENAREAQDMPAVLATIILILLVGISIELIVFAPLERHVLRSRGLLASDN
ncbi:ABC transporter permease [Streptomyces sp. NPDC001393]